MFRLCTLIAAVALATLAPAAPATAQGREGLGWGRFFTNDFLGDGQDRWRTSSYGISRLRGPAWTGRLPDRPGAILEYRLRADIIAPENLTAPAPGDRRYVGLVSAGVHSHFALQGAEAAMGLDMVITGEQTGLSALQRDLHELFDMPPPNAAANQLPDRVYPTLVAELGKPYRFGRRLTLRPYAEAQAGAETFARLGGDLTFGGYGTGGLMLRDAVTGQRFLGVADDRSPGLSLTLGGDVAHVFDSEYLPADGPAAEETRSRLRAGVHWQGRKSSAFYGLTWLGEEFTGQRSGQVVGSVRLNLRF